MKAKNRNAILWILLGLLAAVAALMWLLPDGVAESEAATPQSELRGGTTADAGPEDEASRIETTTLVRAGDMAPAFTVPLLDGGSSSLSGLRGKVVLVNFWATWCPPCREELARVQVELIDRFRDRDFVFLPISRGESPEQVARFRERMDYRFPMGLDTAQAIYKLYATDYIPRNYLIGRDGRVVTATVGYQPDEFDALVGTIEQTLQQ